MRPYLWGILLCAGALCSANDARAAEQMTLADVGILKQQLEQCWNPPVGGPEGALAVAVTIDVNQNRTVSAVDIVDKARYKSDSSFHAAADAALHAVRNPKCSPLELPADKYDQWKHLVFTFDPKDML